MVRVLIGCILLTACGPDLYPGCRLSDAPLKVAVNATPSAPAFVRDPDLRDRTLAVVKTVGGLWGLRSTAGIEVTFTDIPFSCGGDRAGAWDGCEACGSIQAFVADRPYYCVEGTAILHEIAHTALEEGPLHGDPNHDDPRWCSEEHLSMVESAVRALTTDPECQLAVSRLIDLERSTCARGIY